jgi:hypothetical protein
MAIFYNEAIFDSAGDYEIGGFELNKKENISWADIYSGYTNRLSDYIDEYLGIAIESYALQGYENPQKEALDALGLVVEDALNLEISYFSKEVILNAIINSEQSQKWILKIKERVQNYSLSSVAQQYGITSMVNPQTKFSIEAKEIMEDSSLESILERLSTIEL